MMPGDFIAALGIPAAAIVDQRLTKKILVENGAPTAADKRTINDGIAEARWVAAIKPTTVGIAPYQDATREYLEIAVVTAQLSAGAKAARIAELIHRAIPYPVLLVTSLSDETIVSAAQKRWSIGEAGKVVLDGAAVSCAVPGQRAGAVSTAFLGVLSIAARPHADLLALYQWWIDAICALQAARRTEMFVMMDSPEANDRRRSALAACVTIEASISTTRALAGKATQMARRVELNLELQRLQHQLEASLSQL